MKVLLVYWHPEPRSFNGAMFAAARETLTQEGHEVKTSDLHEMRFDPVSGRHNFVTVNDAAYFKQQLEELHAVQEDGFAPRLEEEMQKLEWCELMVWQFPLWWFGLPAVLKGWVDRVFAMGRIYGGGFYDEGPMRGRRALLSLTTGGPAESYRHGGGNGDIMGILRPVHRGILRFTGFEVLAPQIVYGPVRQTDAERQAELAAWAGRLRDIGSEAPIDVGAY